MKRLADAKQLLGDPSKVHEHKAAIDKEFRLTSLSNYVDRAKRVNKIKKEKLKADGEGLEDRLKK